MIATVLEKWERQHDMGELSKNLGTYLTGYMEFSPEESEESKHIGEQHCSICGQDGFALIPTSKKKEDFRGMMAEASRQAPSNISPNFKHFWFHARCSSCGADIILMRS